MSASVLYDGKTTNKHMLMFTSVDIKFSGLTSSR